MWRKKSILLIDDNSDELRVFITALNELGIAYNASYAKSPEQGLKILHGLLPDFIFLDIHSRDDFECLGAIKKIKKLRDVPIVIYSKPLSDEIRRDALRMGSVVFVRKTSNLKVLTETLKMIVTPSQKEVQLFYS